VGGGGMKETTTLAIINASMWLSVGTAIIITVITTGRISPLWFFLIPALVRTVYNGNDKKEGSDDE
jgi:hypothetical protein